MHDILRKANDSASYANIDIPFVFPGLPPWLFWIVFFYPVPPLPWGQVCASNDPFRCFVKKAVLFKIQSSKGK